MTLVGAGEYREGMNCGRLRCRLRGAMYCPLCKAEYRQGFTRCSDCGVDLVNDYVEAESFSNYSKIRVRETPDKWSAVLWRGTDPHFYLYLLGALGSMKVPCLGRPVNLPMYESFEQQQVGSCATVEFEIRVSEENLSFARWILDSAAEVNKEEESSSDNSADEDDDSEVALGVEGVCPLCFAEFPTLAGTCPNCEVPLRPPKAAAVRENPAKELCYLPHPQFMSDLRGALRGAGIPFNNANIPHGPDSRRTDVLVLDSDFDYATRVLAQVLQYWEFDRSIRVGLSRDPRESYWPTRAKDNSWYLEDLELPIWKGTNVNVLDSVGMALREHEVPYRVDSPEPGNAKVCIHPKDQELAREILREVVEGSATE